MRRRKRRGSAEEVELNLAAMLDMAFQLLAFFILTFKPAPMEGQVNLRLPPPIGITREGTEKAGSDTSSKEPPKGLTTLVISAFSDRNGMLAALAVGETPVGNVQALGNRLATVFADKTTPFDQVIIQVGQDLRYDELMKVVEECTKQKLPDGSRLSKLSFVEVPSS
jgi:biopolymer transport protein ExbD